MIYANFQVTQSAKRLTYKVTQVDMIWTNDLEKSVLNCASVYVIEPQKHEMLDFTLVPKLLGFFQWNYNRELVLLRFFFG